jgi:ubiquinone/menaquinone biosynthesis C-methylase UbiE
VNFDLVAPCYEPLERIAFADDLQRCRVAYLGEINPSGRALFVGEGNGRFLCELLGRYPEIEVDCLDASKRMLQLARRRIEQELPASIERVRFIHTDIRSWAAPEHHYDLVVTHFFLDCFQEPVLIAIIKTLARAAAKNATWLVSEFSIPEKGIGRVQARCWLRTMYWFFRVTAGLEASELIDYTPFLGREGFRLLRQHLFRKGILKSELWKKRY